MLNFAIGDIHGRFDLLGPLLDHIETDAAECGGATVVFLGDYIDRGLQSREVLERLIEGPRTKGVHYVFLQGNHEAMLIEAVEREDRRRLPFWLKHGGIQTLVSLGAKTDADLAEPGRVVDEDLFDWIAGTQLYWEDEHRIYVHAGMAPGLALADQSPEDLQWTCSPHHPDYDHGKLMVHGHTISLEPDRQQFRLGIDTGAYRTGTLTAARFVDGDPATFVQARNGKTCMCPPAPASIVELG